MLCTYMYIYVISAYKDSYRVYREYIEKIYEEREFIVYKGFCAKKASPSFSTHQYFLNPPEVTQRACLSALWDGHLMPRR